MVFEAHASTIPEGTVKSNTHRSVYLQVPIEENHLMDNYERLQALLTKIRARFCQDVSARLAKKIGRDESYVNRLFYPKDKKGAKGIGPDIMKACRDVFDLPRGFWDMHPDEIWAADEVEIPGHPAAPSTTQDVTIEQFKGVGGGMGRPRLVLADQPGVIRSWHVNHDWLRLNVKDYTSVSNLKIVTGFGHSMKPMFNPGDPLLVDIGVNRIDQEGVFFFRIGDDGYIKTIQRIPLPGGKRLLKAKSRNSEEFEDLTVDEETMDFHVLGKVLTVWRSEQY